MNKNFIDYNEQLKTRIFLLFILFTNYNLKKDDKWCSKINYIRPIIKYIVIKSVILF